MNIWIQDSSELRGPNLQPKKGVKMPRRADLLDPDSKDDVLKNRRCIEGDIVKDVPMKFRSLETLYESA